MVLASLDPVGVVIIVVVVIALIIGAFRGKLHSKNTTPFT